MGDRRELRLERTSAVGLLDLKLSVSKKRGKISLLTLWLLDVT